MKGKTLKQITNTSKTGLKEIPSLPSNEDFTIDLISKQSSKVYKINVNELNSGTGGGIQSIQEGTNIAIDYSDPLNLIISATDSASSLFPNEVKLVLSSRDFQSDDKDFFLYCPVPGTIITMPATNPFSEGDYVGVVMSSPDSYFETYNNGSGGTDKMYPYTANPTGTTLEQQSSSEVVILRALNQGTLWILPLCGAVKESVDINGNNFKTLARYNYDQSQNAIPLSGTEVGSPVTGNIEVNNGFSLYSNGVDSGSYSAYSLDDIAAIISTNDGYTGYISSITLNPNYVSFSSTNPESVGIVGIEDFTANITDLAYTQKKYVGYRGTATLVDGNVTVTTDKIKTGWKIYVSCNTPSGTLGFLSASTVDIVDSVSFVINSTSLLDNSTVNWWIAP